MPPTPEDVRRLVAEAIHPRHFFARGAGRLEWEHVPSEEVPWEVFRGRLLDPAFTRQTMTFESWNIYRTGEGGRSAEPLLAVKWDEAGGRLHVVRAVLSYAHEGYDAGDNVILTREVRKWVRELVGTADLAASDDARELRDELTDLLFRAVVGTSRLPLTSVEAPLPAFSLGELGYFPGTGGAAEAAKRLEFRLRAARPEEVHGLIGDYGDPETNVIDLLKALFNDVSLSPYTDFVGNALLFVEALEQAGRLTAEDVADFLGYLLRQICRHLTAFDLVLFHNRGANYPDALLLDEVLTAYARLIERRPDLFRGDAARLRRRALRQAWLLRAHYRGHAVPDTPTSPGENARVLPPPFARVPEEQLTRPHSRTRQLFAEPAPLGDQARQVLAASLDDLDHPLELRELGTALFLDRPLGAFKAPGEPDATILLSYVAFSRFVAMGRLVQLRDLGLLDAARSDDLRSRLAALPVVGLPIPAGATARPGVASLADALKTADDFALLYTTERAAIAFRYGMQSLVSEDLSWLTAEGRVLIVGEPRTAGGPEVVLTLYDRELRRRLELSMDPRPGFVTRRGVELPRAGFVVRYSATRDSGSNPGSHA